MERVRQLTPRNWGGTLASVHRPDQRVAARLASVLRDRLELSEMQVMRKLDAHIRRRLRAILLRHWKRKRTIARNLITLGVKPGSAWRQVYSGRKSRWALSHTPRSRSRPAPRVLRRPRADLAGRAAPPRAPAHRRPRPATTGAMGIDSRSQTGRRRGSQPAVPKSRVRTAHARFCGSRGGQPPRLPDARWRCAPPGPRPELADEVKALSARRARSTSCWPGLGPRRRSSGRAACCRS